jgi:hypothetical protein
MKEDNRIIEMTLDGDFVSPPPPPTPPIGTKIMLWAIIAAVVSMSLLIVVLTLWFVAMILPAVLILSAICYLAYRYQVWRMGRGVLIRRGRW